jgi:hypothetical protein
VAAGSGVRQRAGRADKPGNRPDPTPWARREQVRDRVQSWAELSLQKGLAQEATTS